MAEKTIGISRDLIIHPGKVIEEILENKGVTKAELSELTGFSKSFISNVIKGKKDISAKFAMKVSLALGIERSLLIKLQANYDEELAYYEEFNLLDEKRIKIFSHLDVITQKYKDSFPFTKNNDEKMKIKELKEFLRIGDITHLKEFARGNFRLEPNQEVNEYCLGAFVRIADNTTRAIKLEKDFERNSIDHLTKELNKIRNKNLSNPVLKIKEVFADNGIAFEVLENFKGAPALGYISKRLDGKYGLIVTIKPKTKKKFWFTLFHELGHLYNNDLIRNKAYLDFESYDDEIEDKANDFANKCLLVK